MNIFSIHSQLLFFKKAFLHAFAILGWTAQAAGPTGPGMFFNWNNPTRIFVGSGNSTNCVIKADKTLKCWGFNDSGQLGKGHMNNLGDGANEMGANLTPIDLGTGRYAKFVTGGGYHTCAILDNNDLKCWGYNNYGQLGLGDTALRGDGPNEMGNNLPSVNLGTGRYAKSVSLTVNSSCALLDNNTIKCWGTNEDGITGAGDISNRGDAANEMGDNLPIVPLGTGRTARQLVTGSWFACALLDNYSVKCWGYNANGQLGQGHTNSIGDNANEMGDNLSAISLGTGRTAKLLTAGHDHVCAVLDNDSLKCWGKGVYGALGLGSKSNVGDRSGQMGDSLATVNLGTGRTVKSIQSFEDSNCAILDNNTIKCWGRGDYGQLGNGGKSNLGDGNGEMGDSLPVVNLGTGFSVYAISSTASAYQICAVSTTNAVKCWGFNSLGELGQGDINHRGDAANEMGDFLLPVSL